MDVIMCWFPCDLTILRRIPYAARRMNNGLMFHDLRIFSCNIYEYTYRTNSPISHSYMHTFSKKTSYSHRYIQNSYFTP